MKISTKMRTAFVTSGILSLLLGIIVLIYPIATMATLAVLLGCGLLVTGISYIIAYCTDKEFKSSPTWVLVIGILDVLIALFLLFNIPATTMALPFVIGFWILFNGVSRIAASVSFQRLGIKNWWIVLMAGIIGIIFAFLIMFNPVVGAVLIAVYLGIYFMLIGIMNIAEAFLVRTTPI